VIQIQAYIRANGSIPFEEWLKSLNSAAVAKVIVAQSRLALGNTSNVKWFDGIGEYRINWGPGYRIYMAQDGPSLILLYAGGTKQGQQTDINFALMLHQEYQERKKQLNQEQSSQSEDSIEQKKPKFTPPSKRKRRR
jgi:putative addiction module killer protein